MLHFLKEPYPLSHTNRRDLLFILGVSVFVGWFIVTFQVGRTYDWEHPYKKIFLWGYSLVVSIPLMIMRFLLPKLTPNFFREEKWTVGKNILYILLSFMLAIVACFFYYTWFFELPFKWKNLMGFFMTSSTIAVFPITAYVLIDYIRRLKKYERGAQKVAIKPADQSSDPPGRTLSLKDDQEQEQLSLSTNDILYLQSAANYIEVFYLENETVNRFLLRNTLKKVEEQLPVDSFLRVHRSYVVNLSKVDKVTGNAQGYKLHFPYEIAPAPVSRSKSTLTLETLEA